MCFGCGVFNPIGLQLRFFDEGPGVCRAELMLDERYQGFPGIAHGGIVATILDEAMFRAPLSGDHNRFMMTGKLEVRYRQPTPLHQPLIAQGRLLHDRRRVTKVASELRLTDGTILAEATAILTAISAEVLPETLASAGWQIYP